MSILAIGSIALDTIKTPFGKVKNILGGSAVYFSVSASHFTSVKLVAVVGEDFPEKHILFLKNKNIDLNGLSIKKGKTFHWEGEYSWNFSNPKTITTDLNVFADFNPELSGDYRKSKYIFLANIDPEIQVKVLNQIKNPKLVACDTMNYWIENKRKKLINLLKRVDIFIINESESKELTYEANLIKAGKKILRFGPKIIVIKKGEHGVLLFTKDHMFTTPAYLLESVFDPTGAGDTFAGGFMGYLAKHKKIGQGTLRKAVIYGSIMATFAVEDFSLGKLGSISKSDIEKRIKTFKKITSFEIKP
ncbi:MAG: PfkB family carbohydrate kinase [Candidatus Omnitrophica bacterium]|nr:PfkB family carbohydrate kinase [Candidatus Omnitrophota bacterium]